MKNITKQIMTSRQFVLNKYPDAYLSYSYYSSTDEIVIFQDNIIIGKGNNENEAWQNAKEFLIKEQDKKKTP